MLLLEIVLLEVRQLAMNRVRRKNQEFLLLELPNHIHGKYVRLELAMVEGLDSDGALSALPSRQREHWSLLDYL